MARPDTGPYRRGIYLLPDRRGCDRCHVRASRSTGGYVKTSPLKMIWCCAKCKARLLAAGMELAA